MDERPGSAWPASSRSAAGNGPQAEAAPASGAPSLVAYRLFPGTAMRLVPAAPERAWLEETRGRLADRLPPLMLANRAGWVALNSHPLLATWDGGEGAAALRLVWQGEPPYPAAAHLGHGVLIWRLPYLFRTPPGWDLLVRGPSNWPKDGIAPLEGLVETDRAAATVAMTWKLTAIETPVRFEMGEPVCQLVPQRRGELDAFVPEMRDIAAALALRVADEAWLTGRARFPTEDREPDLAADRRRRQSGDVHGTAPAGARPAELLTGPTLRPFVEADDPRPPPGTPDEAA